MRRLALASTLLLACSASLFGAYTYYHSLSNMSSFSWSQWYDNGNLAVQSFSGTYGLGGTNSYEGAAISNLAIPDGTNDYEVIIKIGCTYSGSCPGNKKIFLRASTDTNASGTAGTYYEVSLLNDNAYIKKRVSGTVTQLATTGLGTGDGQVVRAVINGSKIAVYKRVSGVDLLYLEATDTAITSGKPGVGLTSLSASYSTYFSEIYLGPGDQTNPNGITSGNISSSSFSNRVDFQWTGLTDGVDGTGIQSISVTRNGTPIASGVTSTFSDATVAAGTSYTYNFTAYDYHRNSTSVNVSVTTPPTGSIDPRRTGVRPTGAYWGAMGEQIDLLSGNLNYTIPLLAARGRGGRATTFNLTYNSQNWRSDGGGVWNLSEDVGYGYGWKLLAGSLTPFWSDYLTVNHYLFTDSTGATYRLDQNASGIWTTKEGVFFRYDAAANKLYSTDGTSWYFGAIAAGDELDAGTRYPTLIQDPNGNQVKIRYAAGAGTGGTTDTSARILEIEDVRAVSDGGSTRTYQFIYDGSNHLTEIQNRVATLASLADVEHYAFTYSSSQTLTSPFSGTYGTTKVLQSITSYTPGTDLVTTLTTDTSGLLTKVTFPYGGWIRWAYANYTYLGSRQQPEVQNRYLSSNGSTESTYPISRDSGDSSRTVHLYAEITDPGGVGKKKWVFDTTASNYTVGLLTSREDWHLTGGAVKKAQTNYTWYQTTNGSLALRLIESIQDPGGSQISKFLKWWTDDYGNTTMFDVKAFNQSSTSQALRSWTTSSASDSNYTSRHIYGLPASVQLTDGSTSVTLVSYAYDANASGTCSSYGSLNDISSPTLHDTTNYGTSFTYRGNVTQVTTLDGGVACAKYDILGNSPQQLDKLGRTHTATYGSAQKYAVPTASGLSMYTNETDYNSLLGVTQTEYMSNVTGVITYDADMRPTETTDAFGVDTTYEYSVSPPYVIARTVDPTDSTKKRWSKTSLDGLGRPVLVEAGYEVSGTPTTLTKAETEYAPCACTPIGKVYRTSLPHAPGTSARWTTYTYDGLGRTVSIQAADGASTTTYSYLANTVTVTDPAGGTQKGWKKFTVNELGQITKVTEPQPTSGTWDTNYTYNLLGQLTQVSMTRGSTTQTRSFTYNSIGQLTQSATPEQGTWNYYYNSNGTVSHYIDAKNQKIAFIYDSLGRPTYRKVFLQSTDSSEDSCQTVNYIWDQFWYYTPPFSMDNINGRLAGMVYYTCAPGGQTQYAQIHEMYSYTTQGQVKLKEFYKGDPRAYNQYNSNKRLRAELTYDAQGRLSTLKYPTTSSGTGATYTYEYDSMGRPSKMKEGSTEHVNNITYGPAGEMLTINYLGYAETREYNTLYQMTKLTASLSGVTQTDFRYNFSATQNNGKITSMQDVVSGETVEYTYDSLNRLATAATTSSAWGQSYVIDGFGNLLQQNVTKGTAPTMSISVNGTTNRVNGVSYDNNGNDLTYGTYDGLNRLTDAVGTTNNFYYDPGNKRVAKGDGYRFFFWLGNKRLGEYEWSGSTFSTVSTNLYFHGRLIKTGSTAMLTDRLGSNVTGGKRYFPWGQEKPSATTNGVEKFTGYFRDSETGLDYADQRYHEPGRGRFVTPDPAKDGLNWYSYAGSDPINNVDPNGLLTIIIPGIHTDRSWGQDHADFVAAVGATFGETPIVWTWEGKAWNTQFEGEINGAANELWHFLTYYQFAPGETLNIVAHSHGGNIAKQLTAYLGVTNSPIRVDNLVLLATPHRGDFTVNPSVVNNYLNVYSPDDYLQPLGGSIEQIVQVIIFETTIIKIVNSVVDVEWYHMLELVAGATLYAMEQFEILAQRTDPCARNASTSSFGFEGIGHNEIHSVSIWRAIVEPLLPQSPIFGNPVSCPVPWVPVPRGIYLLQ